MKAYFDAVKKALADGHIHRDDYCNLLVGANKAGFTPLHDALKSGNSDNMKAYFDAVEKVLAEGHIKARDYRNLLVSANCAGFTPLHQAAASGSLEIVRRFFMVLEQHLDRAEIDKLLNIRVRGCILFCPHATAEAQNINEFLQQKRQQYSFDGNQGSSASCAHKRGRDAGISEPTRLEELEEQRPKRTAYAADGRHNTSTAASTCRVYRFSYHNHNRHHRGPFSDASRHTSDERDRRTTNAPPRESEARRTCCM
jgi:ankyrin repeat protein